MAVILSNLNPLHKSMQRQNLTRQKFEYTKNNVHFDVFFFVDNGLPYELLFGVKGHSLAFHFDIPKPYTVEDIRFKPEGTLQKLKHILGITAGTGESFNGQTFLKDLKSKIPTIAKPEKIPEAHETAYVKPDPTDGDYIYFWRWQDNVKRKTNNTKINLDKTERLLGKDIRAMCERKNLSSQWTDDPTKKSTP